MTAIATRDTDLLLEMRTMELVPTVLMRRALKGSASHAATYFLSDTSYRREADLACGTANPGGIARLGDDLFAGERRLLHRRANVTRGLIRSHAVSQGPRIDRESRTAKEHRRRSEPRGNR